MSNPKNLDFAVSQTQDNLGLANIPNLKNLDLAVSQAQSNVGLVNIVRPKELGLSSQLSSR
jgi:hypothetical protein